MVDVPPGTDVAPDGGVDDAAVTDDAADGAVDAGSGIDCAPGPTGGTAPAGTAPQQAGRSDGRHDGHAARAVRPQSPTGNYTIQKALAQGYVINNGTPPDGGVGPVTYSLNDNWDPQTNGIGDPATFTPMFTVAADGSGTHTNFIHRLQRRQRPGVCGRVYIRRACRASTAASRCSCRARRRRRRSPSTARSRTPRRR